jgi:monoamine oxidase
VKELGIQTYPTWTKGHNVFVFSGKVRKYREIPQADPISILNLGLVLRQFAKWSDEVPLEAPWTAKRAKEWDSMTVATWINNSAKSATARKMLTALMNGIYTADPGEVSMLFALFQTNLLNRLAYSIQHSWDKFLVLGYFIASSQSVLSHILPRYLRLRR